MPGCFFFANNLNAENDVSSIAVVASPSRQIANSVDALALPSLRYSTRISVYSYIRGSYQRQQTRLHPYPFHAK